MIRLHRRHSVMYRARVALARLILPRDHIIERTLPTTRPTPRPPVEATRNINNQYPLFSPQWCREYCMSAGFSVDGMSDVEILNFYDSIG